MSLRWLIQDAADHPLARALAPAIAGAGAGTSRLPWLAAAEQERVARLRFPHRRRDFLIGRWTAKRAVAACRPDLGQTEADLGRIEIHPAADGAPEVWIDGQAAELQISISHCGGRGLCVVGPAGVAVGCDLEQVEPRSAAFLADYFTPAEQQQIAALPAGEAQVRGVTLLWSAKESALKALREGLRLDTRDVEVTLGATQPGWSPLIVRYADGKEYEGFWQEQGAQVMVVVGRPPQGPPKAL